MPVNVNRGESKDEFISRCIGEEIGAGYEQSQAAAICYSYWDKDKMSKITEMSSNCLLYTSPSPRDRQKSRMPSSA